MAGGAIFAELHVLSGERQESSHLVGVATSPVLSLFKQRRGQLFTLIEPSIPDDDGVCRRLIETIEDEYFRDSTRSVTSALRQALTAANERLRAENSKAPVDKQLRVGLSCAAVREKDVFIAQAAPANAFILHGGSVKRVLSTYSLVPDASGNGTNRASDSLGALLQPHVNLAYSLIEEGDLVVLASGAYWKLIPDRYILDAGRHIDPEMAASELYGCYTAHTRRPTASVLVIRISDLPARQGGGRSGRHAKADRVGPKAAGPNVELRAEEKRPRARSAPIYPQGPPLEPVGKPLVRLRERWPRWKGGGGGPAQWIGRMAAMLLLAALFVLLGNVAINAWVSWQLGDPVAMVREAQEKRALAATAESQAPARALLDESYQLLIRALRAKNDEATRAMAASVLAEIDRIDRTVRIGRVDNLVDYSAIIENKGDVTQLALDGKDVYVLDEGLDRLYKYTLTPQGTQVFEPGEHQLLVRRGDRLDGAAVGDLLSLTWMPAGQLRSSPALFALESGRSIVDYDANAGLSRIEVSESQRWGSIQAISGFAGGLYLLDTKLKGIFYYPPTKNGYESEPYTIVDSRARVDLEKAVDIALDGNLYVLEGSGAIKRFSREGRPLDFGGDLPDGPIKDPRALFASANTRSVYVVDGQGERIIQFSPEGKLQRQFKADGVEISFQGLRDLFVDEVGRKLYALAHKSLFVFDMPATQD